MLKVAERKAGTRRDTNEMLYVMLHAMPTKITSLMKKAETSYTYAKKRLDALLFIGCLEENAEGVYSKTEAGEKLQQMLCFYCIYKERYERAKLTFEDRGKEISKFIAERTADAAQEMDKETK